MYILRARLYYDTCPSLHGHGSSLQPADRPIDQYVHTHSRPECQRYVRFDRVGPDCQALPCVRRCSWWVPAVRGRIILFFCPDALPCVRRCSWWVPVVRGETIFREIRWPVRWVPAVRWRNNYFARNKEALPCCGRGPSCQLSGGRRGSGCPCVEEYEGSLVRCGVRMPSPQNNRECG